MVVVGWEDLTLWTLGRELLRFVLLLAPLGITSDLLFSPLHRFMHAKFPQEHGMHHEYTRSLTSLVLSGKRPPARNKKTAGAHTPLESG